MIKISKIITDITTEITEISEKKTDGWNNDWKIYPLSSKFAKGISVWNHILGKSNYNSDWNHDWNNDRNNWK